MDSLQEKRALISGASIAGLTTAYWLGKLGYRVTVVELAGALRTSGAAVNVGGGALDVARRMGILEQLRANALCLESWEIKNADDTTVSSPAMPEDEAQPTAKEYLEIEIERDKLLAILAGALGADVEFIFSSGITKLRETASGMEVTLKDSSQRTVDLVVGCDGSHSGVRKLWFGHEAEYAQFLKHYFSLTIVNKLLVKENTAQMYNVPGKVIILNAYNNKTDIIFSFFSEEEIPYDYRDTEQQSAIVLQQFAGQGWRTAELLAEMQKAETTYFDKFCQVVMPSWTKGRVALVGDAGYCASPAAGMGGALAMIGAAAVADALAQHPGNMKAAFQAYNQQLRPFIAETQATALAMLTTYFVPRTEEAIRRRNAQPLPF